MLLKSIKFKNFRQFIDEEISFSTDKDKNVTFIMANNYTGKTTIANAFTWCLFGKTNFTNGILLNRKIQNELPPRSEVSVEVEVRLQYGNNDYCVKRTQNYKNNPMMYGAKSIIQPDKSDLYITYKDPETGLTKPIPPDKVQDTLNIIIPQDLADYFFLRAEQINSFGKNVQEKTSSTDFSAAVKKILGMESIENTIKHLVVQQNSVQTIFQKRYNGNANAKIEKIQNSMEDLENQIGKNIDDIKNAENDLEILTERNAKLTNEIKKWADGKKQQEEIDIKQSKVDELEKLMETTKSSFLSNFANQIASYCLPHIVPEVLKMLKETKVDDKNVPNVNNKTIEFLLKRGTCICGSKLDIGSECHSNLVKLLDYVPPKYIGATISEYISYAKAKTDKDTIPNLSLLFNQYKQLQMSRQSEIDKNYEVITDLKKHLKAHKDTAQYEIERSENEQTIKSLVRNISTKKTNNIQYESQLKAYEKELQKIAQEDEANKHVCDCINHTKYIANVLKSHLETNETALRTSMVNKMNEIYSSVFTSSYKINLNEKYKLSITDTLGVNDVIDTSGAQSVFIVLAFITSVLFLAQQIHYKKYENEEAGQFLMTEPYPLVLDAPFSAFDRESATIACKKLPDLTEQIIIFSKDMEGMLIKEQLHDKIGKYYTMKAATLDGNAKDVLETNVKEADINDANI